MRNYRPEGGSVKLSIIDEDGLVGTGNLLHELALYLLLHKVATVESRRGVPKGQGLG